MRGWVRDGAAAWPPRPDRLRLLTADLEDHARAGNLDERTVYGRAHKMRVHAQVTHGAIVHDVGATVRTETDIGRAVEPVGVGTDERLFTAGVAGKPLDEERHGLPPLLVP